VRYHQNIIFLVLTFSWNRLHLRFASTGVTQGSAILSGSSSLRSMLNTIRGRRIEVSRRQRA
jgi:hypothetical protein